MNAHRVRAATVIVIMLAAGGVLALSVPAGARPADAARGASSARTAVTEDDDRDGVRNTPDPSGDSDNRHPSGRDRHAEGGRSRNQGGSRGEPDANGRGPERDQGGLDQPDGPGGLDQLDQDGNNGCGNDDDFEDDNEGLCTGRERSHESLAGTESPARSSGRPASRLGVAGGAVEGPAVVRGATFEAAGPRPRALPSTGAPAATLALLAVAFASGGVLLLAARPPTQRASHARTITSRRPRR